MARKQLGQDPQGDTDATDVGWVDIQLSGKYSLPPGGIPGIDLADNSITPDKLEASDGEPTDTTFYRGDGSWMPILGNSILVTPDTDYTLAPPPNPLNGEMVMFEIRPTLPILVTIPDTVLLTSGLPPTFTAPQDKSAFVGIRWSPTAAAWHVLAITVQS